MLVSRPFCPRGGSTMQLLFRWTGLLLLITAFVLPASGADKKGAKKGDDDTEKKDSKSDKKTDAKGKDSSSDYVVVATLEGTLTQVAAAQKTFTIQLTQRVPDPAAF